jgi:hypothetical protein
VDTLELADTIADPIGTVGMSIYFSPQAMTRGEGLELDVVTFYAGGRGGVLGDIDALEGYGGEDRTEGTEELVSTRLAVEGRRPTWPPYSKSWTVPNVRRWHTEQSPSTRQLPLRSRPPSRAGSVVCS